MLHLDAIFIYGIARQIYAVVPDNACPTGVKPRILKQPRQSAQIFKGFYCADIIADIIHHITPFVKMDEEFVIRQRLYI